MRNRQDSSLLACFKHLSISIRRVYCIEISNQRILCSIRMDTLRLLIWGLLEFGIQIIQKIHLVHLGIWLQRWCANSLMVLQWITSRWESLAMNACLDEDHTLEETEEKSENTFSLNKYRSKELTFHLVGPSRLLTLSTDWFKESLWTD